MKKIALFVLSLVSTIAAAQPTPTDCLFNWAEDNYSSLFLPSRTATQSFGDYTLRHYTETNSYLGISNSNSHLYFYAPTASNIALLDLGLVATWQQQAGCNASTLSAPTGIAATNVDTQTVSGISFGSSSKLDVSWTAPANSSSIQHYRIRASEALMNTSVSAETTATSITLSGLKAATPYSITVSACADAGCSQPAAATAVSATTSEEYWQLQGSGQSTSGLTKVVADGNARISATRFGADAGANANRIQLYYGALGGQPLRPVAGASVATTSLNTSADNSASYLAFTSLAGSSGVNGEANVASGTLTSIRQVATAQAVPLSTAMGSKVRLFFEASDSNNLTRIWHIDSQDGYLGRDFNAGAETLCNRVADFASGGHCQPTQAIGIDGDAVGANAKIRNARQFKLGWPILDDWRWDGAVGTFMLFTTDSVSGCSTYGMNHGYAVWDGTQWQVQYATNGCPKLFASAQAMFPLHVGGARYKGYYGDPSLTTGRITSSTMPFLGPKKLIYADGTRSGSASVVDFEDWESQDTARNVHFLWPDGSLLNDQAEGYIDDYHFLMPTGNSDLQVMYMAITAGTEPPFAAAAILLNP